MNRQELKERKGQKRFRNLKKKRKCLKAFVLKERERERDFLLRHLHSSRNQIWFVGRKVEENPGKRPFGGLATSRVGL